LGNINNKQEAVIKKNKNIGEIPVGKIPASKWQWPRDSFVSLISASAWKTATLLAGLLLVAVYFSVLNATREPAALTGGALPTFTTAAQKASQESLTEVATITSVADTLGKPAPLTEAEEQEPLPEGVSQDWLSQIQQRITKSEYHIRETGQASGAAKYQAANRAQNLRTYFEPDGIRIVPREQTDQPWEWGLVLTGIGSDKNIQSVEPAILVTTDNRIEYQRDLITEWYKNDDQGLEQGFTIHKPIIDDAQNTIVQMQIRGDLEAELSGTTVKLGNSELGHMLNYNKLVVWDANKQGLDAHFELNGDTLVIAVNTQDAVYPIVIDPLVTGVADSVLQINQDYSDFGRSVASAGDINSDGYGDVIVGDPTYDDGENNEGAAFVFLGSPAGLISSIPWGGASNIGAVAILQSNQAGSLFGQSVAGIGDIDGNGYDDVIVGAPNYTDGQSGEGAAFIFYSSANGITSSDPTTAINASVVLQSNQIDAMFGYSVAAAGDIDNDTYLDLIVGSPYYDDGEPDEGTAFVFYGTANGIASSDPSITDPVTGVGAGIMLYANVPDAHFGTSVASAGDIDGDGYDDVIIGVPDSGGFISDGSALIYYGASGGIPDPGSYASLWHASDTVVSTYNFGSSVDGAGDVNGDGYDDVIIGYPHYTDGQNVEGAAFIYYGSSTRIKSTNFVSEGIPDITLQSNQVGAGFGYSVAHAGDLNSDGYDDVVVGARSYYNGVSSGGAAFIFYGSPNGIGSSHVNNTDPVTGIKADILLSGDISFGFFGSSVASAGDVNGDGFGDLIIGEPNFSENQPEEGGALTFYGSGSGIISSDRNDSDETNGIRADVVGGAGQPGVDAGWSVSSAGDFNGDGFSDVIIGVPHADFGQADEGVVFIHYGAADGDFRPLSSLRSGSTGQTGSQFGSSVDSAGDINGDGYDDIVIGAPYYDDSVQTNEGTVFIFYGLAGGSIPSNTLPDVILQANQADSKFGASVAGAGDLNADGYADVVVGAYQYDDLAQLDEGAGFVFYGSANGIASSDPTAAIGADVVLQSNHAGARFGYSVDAAGDINGDGFGDLIIGATHYSEGEVAEGSVYTFHGSANHLQSSDSTNSELINGVKAKTQLQSNQDSGLLGSVVAGIGDVNGDGYDDVAAYASYYTPDGPSAFIFHGSGSGILSSHPANPDVTNGIKADVELHLPLSSIASAGDVNQDGYDDVIAGYASNTDGQGTEGAAFIFHGSANGIPPFDITTTDINNGDNPAVVLQSNQSGAQFGFSAANAGDVNGDGYNDIIVGAPKYDGQGPLGQVDAGGYFIFHPNRLLGQPLKPVLLKESPSTDVALHRVSNVIRAGIKGFHPKGSGRIKLTIEACPPGVPFNDATCTTATQSAWTTVILTGVDLIHQIDNLNEGVYSWRMRVLYDPTTIGYADPKASPWFDANVAASYPYVRLIVDTNGDGQSDNVAPTISGIPTTSAVPDAVYSFIPGVNDRNLNDTQTFSIQNLPVWASFDTATGELSGTPVDAHFGSYDNIVISVTDSGGLSVDLAAFNILVVDNKAPTILSEVIYLGNGQKQITLTCVDGGSGCNGDIYYSDNQIYPPFPGFGTLYSGPIVVDDYVVLNFFSSDLEANSSTGTAHSLDITSPATDEVVNTLTSISGTYIDTGYSEISFITLQVSDDAGNGLVDVGGSLFLVNGFPQPLQTTLDTLTETWSLTTAVAWAQDTTYTITAKATDIQGHVATVTSSFTYYNGAPTIFTTLDLNLSANSILNIPGPDETGAGQISAAIKLTNPGDLNENLFGEEVTLQVLDPNGQPVDLYSGGPVTLATNNEGQLTLLHLGDGTTTDWDPGPVDVSDNFDIDFDTEGPWTLQAHYAGDLKHLPASSDPVVLLVGESAGTAVIVVGRAGGDNEGMASHNKTAKRIYDTLIARSFQPNEIRFLSPDTNRDGLITSLDALNCTGLDGCLDIDGVTPNGIDGIPNLIDDPDKNDPNNVQTAIEGLAALSISTPAPRYVFMIDHGNVDQFLLNGTGQTILPSDLDTWLGTLEQELDQDPGDAKDKPTVVVLGMCYSGSFVDEVAADVGTLADRVVIASAGPDEESFKGLRESDGERVGEFFIEEFIKEAGRGASLAASAEYAIRETEIFTRKSDLVSPHATFNDVAAQHPLIEDNRDFDPLSLAGNNKLSNAVGADGDLSRSLFLGIGPNFATNAGNFPADIVSVNETLYLPAPPQGSTTMAAVLTMEAANNGGQVNAAWIEVRSPVTTYTPVGSGVTEQVEPDLANHFMTAAGGGSYVGVFSGFTTSLTSGKNEVFYVVEDISGVISPIRRSLVYVDDENNTAPTSPVLVLPADLATTDDAILFDWEASTDPESDPVTYTLEISTDDIFGTVDYRKEEVSFTYTTIADEAGLQDSITYYWRIIAVDAFGERGTSGTFSFTVNLTNALRGVVQATVTNAIDDVILQGAIVTAVDQNNQPVEPDPDQIFYMPDGPGGMFYRKYPEGEGAIYDVTIDLSSEGFAPHTEGVDLSVSGAEYSTALQGDDSDGDGLSDSFETSIGTNPNEIDSDFDGLNDDVEVGFDGNAGAYDPYHPTTNSSGTDLDANSADTDQDGLTDDEEVNNGADPLDDQSWPNFADGDLNGDGNVNAGDYLIANRIVLDLLTATPTHLAHGDMYPATPDGVIDLSDLLLIQQAVIAP